MSDLFLVLFGFSLHSLEWAERLAEVEPFKTSIILKFDRAWPYVLFAAGMLIPGLYEMHAHLGREDAMENVLAGITSVRDIGNRNEVLDSRQLMVMPSPKRLAAGRKCSITVRALASGEPNSKAKPSISATWSSVK